MRTFLFSLFMLLTISVQAGVIETPSPYDFSTPMETKDNPTFMDLLLIRPFAPLDTILLEI